MDEDAQPAAPAPAAEEPCFLCAPDESASTDLCDRCLDGLLDLGSGEIRSRVRQIAERATAAA